MGEVRACEWCRSSLEVTARRDQRFCSKKCRQWAHRLRRRIDDLAAAARPMHFAYADPPYPGLARRYYGDQPTYVGEVDHAALIADLERRYPQGWALSTSSKALRVVLPMCPEGARVCPWVKPIGVPGTTIGPHNTWEPLIVVRGRARRLGARDWLSAMPARHGGDLPGRKPIAFCAWMFAMLGMLPGDTLDDLFPGTGVVSRAWAEASRSLGDASARAKSDASRSAPSDASHEYLGDVSPEVLSDASPEVERHG